MTGSASPSSCTGSLGETTSRIGWYTPVKRRRSTGRFAASSTRRASPDPEPLKAKLTPTASDRPPVTGHFLGQALRRDATTLLAQRVRPADDRPHLASFDEVLQEQKVLLALGRDEGAQPLTHER